MNNYNDENPNLNSIEKYRIFRYIPLGRFKDMLENGMYLPTVNQFEDKREGILPYEAALNPEKLCQKLGKLQPSDICKKIYDGAIMMIELVNKMKNDILISCWYLDSRENYLMWKAYGREEGSVLIACNFLKTVATFERFPEQEKWVSFVERNYVRYKTPIEAYVEDCQYEIFGTKTWDTDGRESSDSSMRDIALSGFFYKHHGFRDENEIRFLFACDFVPINRRINLNSCIEEIIISPYADSKQQHYVKETVKILVPDVQVKISTLNPRNVEILSN